MACHRQTAMLVGLVLAVGLIGGCSSSKPAPTEAAAASAAAQGGPIVDISSYKLGPGDALRVTVFRHEDLSGQFTLDGEGYFAMPLVGEVLGGGRTARSSRTRSKSRSNPAATWSIHRSASKCSTIAPSTLLAK